jgi:16S rRNA (cytidine1402-2'-O)-methyltransferase
MSGTLFVVATPIGNLEDITLRALRVLREVNLIAAEDTRRTSRLLAHYSIATPTQSFHQHNIRERLPQLIRRLQEGQRIAVVTDAGSPGISDPGLEVVQDCISRGIRVEPVPGPSAPLAAAVASGFPLEPLTVLGFPPARAKNRVGWLSGARQIPHTFTFFEAPHRIRRTLSEMADAFGERPICVARELTKVHEQLVRGSSQDVLGQLTEWRGEFTVVVGPQTEQGVGDSLTTDADLLSEFRQLTEIRGLHRRVALMQLAAKHRRSHRDLYAMVERHKGKGE